MSTFNDYHRISESSLQYPNADLAYTKRVVYEEDDIERTNRRHHHHHHPETHERVKVVEYEQVPERRYGTDVVYQENVEVDQYYPQRRTVWP
ncbi:hypothetical protein VNO77_09500 [Canavalia gladiata]|uniref:Uncharacterized protein n=1 Tax=Canavalia gladiata TaxID=3824 RepID=A0AAN9M9Y9_CANGL